MYVSVWTYNANDVNLIHVTGYLKIKELFQCLLKVKESKPEKEDEPVEEHRELLSQLQEIDLIPIE